MHVEVHAMLLNYERDISPIFFLVFTLENADAFVYRNRDSIRITIHTLQTCIHDDG